MKNTSSCFQIYFFSLLQKNHPPDLAFFSILPTSSLGSRERCGIQRGRKVTNRGTRESQEEVSQIKSSYAHLDTEI